MEVKIGTILMAIILIIGDLNCQPINDNDDNLLKNKNRDITLPNNNDSNYSDNSNSSSSSSSSNSSEYDDDSDLINKIRNNEKYNKTTDVPLIFPEDTKNYNILPSNVTLIKKLLHQNRDSSEIEDLNKPASTEITPVNPAVGPIDPTKLSGRNLKLKTTAKPSTKQADYYDDEYKSGEDEDEDFKSEVENVQEKNTKKPKVELEEQFERKDDIKSGEQLPVDMQDIDNPVQYKTGESSSNSLLFIAIVVAIAFICTTIYLSLFVWRRKLEGRYGMRERLVTNDEDVLEDDVHYRNQPHLGQSIIEREVC